MNYKQRTEAYLAELAKMPPEEQRLHFSFALLWLAAKLRKMAATVEAEEQAATDANFLDIMADVDL